MKRDLDLVRAILLEVEQDGKPLCYIDFSTPGYSPEELSYHVQLLRDAGYLEAIDRSATRTHDWRPTSLTWLGHAFIDAARNDSVWHQVKAQLKDKGVDAPLSVIQSLAIKIVATMLGLG